MKTLETTCFPGLKQVVSRKLYYYKRAIAVRPQLREKGQRSLCSPDNTLSINVGLSSNNNILYIICERVGWHYSIRYLMLCITESVEKPHATKMSQHVREELDFVHRVFSLVLYTCVHTHDIL